MQDTHTQASDSHAAAQWRPLSRIQRRVAGVLVEKAKTTPDQYPLSLNALTNGCNQKSNRSPQMNLSPEDVEEALDALRAMGAVSEVHGDGRVVRFRHYLKDWLGVDGTELAVMTELLLRGEQAVGELRARAARMASGQLPDMAALKPIVDGLIAKGLVVALTPEGRGQSVTHALYPPEELDRIRRHFAQGLGAGPVSATDHSSEPSPAAQTMAAGSEAGLREIQLELQALTEQVQKMAKEIEDIWSSLK